MGLFITFEGIDGAGKSTQLRQLAKMLGDHGCDVITTREPGGAPGAEEIRHLLVEGEPDRWSSKTEILLFTAARRDHVERVIEPALSAGKIVLCDRYLDSTRAYQGAEDQRALVDELHTLAIGLMPDVTLIFDMDPTTALARADARRSAEDRFERKGLAFQQDLRERFRKIARDEPDRCHLVDADADEQAVGERVWAAVQPLLATVS
ncbi:MAG: dTMP kinase [Pseudomonadota bacterium]